MAVPRESSAIADPGGGNWDGESHWLGHRLVIRRSDLFLLPIVGHEIEARARDALELGGAFRAGKVVADAERVTFEFVDRRESLAAARSCRAGNGHALGLGGGIQRVDRKSTRL